MTLLLPPGRNEHSFDPTPKDIETAAKSKVGVMVGLGLDPWMEKLMKDAAPKARILKVGDRVPTLTIKDDPIGDEEADKAREAAQKPGAKKEEHEEHEKGATDPHVWLDPRARAAHRARDRRGARQGRLAPTPSTTASAPPRSTSRSPRSTRRSRRARRR